MAQPTNLVDTYDAVNTIKGIARGRYLSYNPRCYPIFFSITEEINLKHFA